MNVVTLKWPNNLIQRDFQNGHDFFCRKKSRQLISYFLKLASVDLAIERVKLRVTQGGHNVLRDDIIRRFARSWVNFQTIYKPLVDSWVIFDTSGPHPVIIDESEEDNEKT